MLEQHLTRKGGPKLPAAECHLDSARVVAEGEGIGPHLSDLQVGAFRSPSHSDGVDGYAQLLRFADRVAAAVAPAVSDKDDPVDALAGQFMADAGQCCREVCLGPLRRGK